MKIVGRQSGSKRWRKIKAAETLDQCAALLQTQGLVVRRYTNELIAIDPRTGYIKCEIRKED